MQDKTLMTVRRSLAALALVGASGTALAQPGGGLFAFSSIDDGVLAISPDTIFATDPGLGGEYGIAARRIAVSEPGVKEHVSNLRMDWPDPFGLEMPVGASVSVALVADTNPNGVGEPGRRSKVTLLKRADVGGATSYGLGFEFGELGSSFAELTIVTTSGAVHLHPFDDGSEITLFGLPPGEPIVRTVKLPPEGIDVDWLDDDDDNDGIFDVDVITVTQLPPLLTGFELPDGTSIAESISSIELRLVGPETELDGVFGFDYLGSGLPMFSVSTPSPGTASLLLAAGILGVRRRR